MKARSIDTDRLRNLLDKKGLQIVAFASLCGISKQTVFTILKGGKTRDDVVNKMAAALGVKPESLYGGELLAAEPEAIYGSPCKITYVPVQAQAGFFTGYDDVPLQLKTFSIPEMPDGKYYAFSVNGDSMSPTIKSGDIVVCSKLSSKEEIKPNAVHVMFDKTDGVVVKRLVVNDAVIRCISDNEKYPEYTMKAHTVKDVYRVRRVITSNI